MGISSLASAISQKVGNLGDWTGDPPVSGFEPGLVAFSLPWKMNTKTSAGSDRAVVSCPSNLIHCYKTFGQSMKQRVKNLCDRLLSRRTSGIVASCLIQKIIMMTIWFGDNATESHFTNSKCKLYQLNKWSSHPLYLTQPHPHAQEPKHGIDVLTQSVSTHLNPSPVPCDIRCWGTMWFTG